jgi:hypothetical protein
MDNQKGQWVECRGGDGAYFGTWMENAVSGIARDLFAWAMPRLEAAGYPITIHVHDEIGAEIPIGFGSNEEFRCLLIELPVWAAGLPLSAKVRRGPRFCKIGPPKAASPAHEPERCESTVSDSFIGPQTPPPPPPRMDGASSSTGHSNGSGKAKRYPHGEDKGGRLLDTYVYKNHLGQLYLKVEKRSPPPGKTRAQYPQFHWTGTDWAIGKPAGPKIPYRLPELLASQATAPTPVHIPEGEKDANSLAALGLIATTCSEGAKPGSWASELNKWFEGVEQVFIPEDNDDSWASLCPGQGAGIERDRSGHPDSVIPRRAGGRGRQLLARTGALYSRVLGPLRSGAAVDRRARRMGRRRGLERGAAQAALVTDGAVFLPRIPLRSRGARRCPARRPCG